MFTDTDEAVNPTLIAHSCEVNHENHEVALDALLVSILRKYNSFSLNMLHGLNFSCCLVRKTVRLGPQKHLRKLTNPNQKNLVVVFFS